MPCVDTLDNFSKAILLYQKEAEACEANHLYLATCALYGALLEAALMGYCLIQLDNENFNEISDADLRDTKLSTLIKELSNANIIDKTMAEKIAHTRNLLHPYRMSERLSNKKRKITKREFISIKNQYFRLIDQLVIKLQIA